MSPIDILHLFPRGPLSQTADDFATLANNWREPQSILSVLTIIGGDIVQGALVQLVSSRPRHFAPAAFSFGWVAYAFSAILATIGSRRLAPNPDCDCVLIDIDKGYARNVRSWPLARLVRDYELPPEAVPSDGGTPRGLTVTFYRTCSQKRTGVADRDWIYYTGVIVILLQLIIAVIPGILVGNWVILILTFGGILLVQAHASLPQWQKELWGARQITKGEREVVCLTRGNGSSYVLVIISDGCGLKLSDLAAGREVLSKTTAPATFLLAVLWIVHLFCVDGVNRDTWYLLAIGAIGMVQNALASGARRVPSALGFHLKAERVVYRTKVFDALREAEEVEAKVGVRLTDIFFPGSLRPDEEAWKQDKLNKDAKEGQRENAAPTGSTKLPSSSSEDSGIMKDPPQLL